MNKATRTLFYLSSITALLSGCQTGHHLNTPQTTNKTAHRIHQKLGHYQQLSKKNWAMIQPDTLPLKSGMISPTITQIRQRLARLGDLPANLNHQSTVYDTTLTTAVKKFQWRHGLKMDGNIGEKTLAALNVAPATRLAQLKRSMKKWSTFPEKVGSRYIRVNVANFELDLLEDGKKIINMKVIAGKPKRPTPEIYSKIQTIVLNPKWNIPKKITHKDIIPKIIDNPDYLAEENISIYSSWKKDAYKIDPMDINWHNTTQENFPYRLSQAPGNNNALGRVKFIFLNKDDVYLHDTPQKGLFAKIQRAFSSGCVRLEHPFELVEYFIQDSDTLEHETVSEKLTSGKTKYVRIKNPMPIYITYITAWVDKNGHSHFREDIYQRFEQPAQGIKS